jgi:hypothetical protein
MSTLCLLVSSLLVTTTVVQGIASTTPNINNIDTTNIQAAVLVPGFLTGADEFKAVCSLLTAKGIPTVAVPMPNWHWIPCLGGRSARPIMERIDVTVQHLIAADGDISKMPTKLFDYNLLDCWADFQDTPGGVASVGGSSAVDMYPVVEPRGTFSMPPTISKGEKKKIALIGHSAGGWIARAYLSDRNYGGKVYNGKQYIHSLVTLGTPQMDAPGPAFESIKWVNQENPMPDVKTLAVGGTGFAGDEWGTFTQGAYTFCSSDGSDGSSFTGDGVTPIQSSLAYEGAETMELPGVHHFCWSDVFGGNWVSSELTQDFKEGKNPWYGSESAIDKWAEFLKR